MCDLRLEPFSTFATLRGERPCRVPLAGLWVRGSLDGLAAPTVAIVGTRAPSDAGRALAWSLGRDLGAAGVCVVSGLALGVDGAAHTGALSAGAPTVGVLGGGHERFFPRRNLELAATMVAKGGAVLSPYAPEERAFPSRFLERNGVIAGLCDAVVVVEAARRSGALNTASWAADAGVPVLAVPGDVDRPKVAGCLALIRDGAVLVRDAADVLEALGLARRPAPRDAVQPALPLLDPGEAAVYDALVGGPCTVDELRAITRVAVPAIMAALGRLVADGYVDARDDAAFARAAR